MAFLAAPPRRGWCGEGTVLNHAFLWQDFEVAKVVLVDLRFCCLLQLEVLGMKEDEKKSKRKSFDGQADVRKSGMMVNQQPVNKKLKNLNFRN